MTKSSEYNIKKQSALMLRQQGKTYADISRKLAIAKSTAKIWLENETFSNKEKRLIESGYKASRIASRQKAVLAKQTKAKKQDELLKGSAKKILNNTILSEDYKKILCATIFWCEGGKNDSGGIYFINSDPKLVATFLSLFRNSFSVDEDRFRALIHLHSYHNLKKQLAFWSKITRIPENQFYKPYRKLHSGKNKHAGYPGCISVRYLDTATSKLLRMIYLELADIL